MFSCEFCKIFKNTFFYRTTPVTASINKNILEKHFLLLIIAINTNDFVNIYGQNILAIFEEEKNRSLRFLSELRQRRKSYLKNAIIGQLNVRSLKKRFDHQGIAISKSKLTRYKRKKVSSSFQMFNSKSMAINVYQKIETSLAEVI